MAYYKVEYWVQEEKDKEVKCRSQFIFHSNSDRKLKMYISNFYKFFPEFSTRWKKFEPDLDFQMWRRDLKQDILADWRKNHIGGCTDVERYVIVKKAISPAAQELLTKKCNNNPHQVYTTY